jgi:predicted metalloprotease with PDZ domain
MSSFFSSLKKATGLGSSKQKLPEISPSYSQYEVVFVESILGLSVSEIKIAVGPASNIESRPHVTAVTPGSAADVAGVRKGDIVIALEGDYSVRFDCFYEFLKTMGRPLTMG